MKRCPTCRQAIPECLADRVRALRERLALTQADLAAAIGVGRGTIAKLEAGRAPRPRTASALRAFAARHSLDIAARAA